MSTLPKTLSYNYTREEMLLELKILIKRKGDFHASPFHNKIVHTYQPHFFEIENNMWKDKKIKDYIVKNRAKYLNKCEDHLTEKELLRGFKISGKHVGFGHFSPLWLKAFIEKYNVDSIYDPCGGWGHRLLGALNVQYIYNDIDTRSYNGVINLCADFDIKNKIFYNNDCSEFSPKEKYACVFTCPPYFNIEKYTCEKTSIKKYPDYSNWLNVWWRNTVKKSYKNNLFSFVINKTYMEDMKTVCIEEGLKFVESFSIGNTKYNHLSATRKNDILIVFN